jgi:hypothetical protein
MWITPSSRVGAGKSHRRHRLIDQALDLELPRYREVVRRLGQ